MVHHFALAVGGCVTGQKVRLMQAPQIVQYCVWYVVVQIESGWLFLAAAQEGILAIPLGNSAPVSDNLRGNRTLALAAGVYGIETSSEMMGRGCRWTLTIHSCGCRSSRSSKIITVGPIQKWESRGSAD